MVMEKKTQYEKRFYIEENEDTPAKLLNEWSCMSDPHGHYIAVEDSPSQPTEL